MEGTSQKKIGQYIVLRTLGFGGTCKVKLGVDTATGKNVAIKIMKADLDEETYKYVMAEVEAMQALQHPNILRQIEYGKKMYEKPNGKSREVTYIVLELAEVGDLFDVVANSGSFSEDLTRYYMKRFIEGLAYCHNAGVVHRDIKIENCLLNNEFEIKINDFGFAAPTEGRTGTGEHLTKLGTECNMAPELLAKHPYNAQSVDLFATAIVAFTMISQHPPFLKAHSSDFYYKYILKNHANSFWEKHESTKKPGFYSESFKDLFIAMIAPDSTHRPTVNEILSHPWFTQGSELSTDEAVKDISGRLGVIHKAQQEARDERRKEKEATGFTSDGKVGRVAELQDEFAKIGETFNPANTKKQMKTIEGPFIQNGTYFFSMNNPDVIELLMKHTLTESTILHTVEQDKYKMRFTYKGKSSNGEEYEVEMLMRMFQYGDKQIYVDFQKLSGDQFNFLKHYRELIFGIKQKNEDGQTVESPGLLTQYNNSSIDTFA